MILPLGEDLLGAPDESVKARLNSVTDLERMVLKAPKAASWQEILDTP
ncbi:MAG: hypothetical protein HYS12_01920 [Planctomycetes bacterium]|nr:hypothetical protein [Planctomycetota bacterium]